MKTMKTDTPRTDAHYKATKTAWPTQEDIEFARELERENAKLREESAEKTAWIDEIFRRLGLPCGDMGALENYILPNDQDDSQSPDKNL